MDVEEEDQERPATTSPSMAGEVGVLHDPCAPRGHDVFGQRPGVFTHRWNERKKRMVETGLSTAGLYAANGLS